MWPAAQLVTLGDVCLARYHELGSHAFGQRRGWWIITIPQLVVMVGLGITCAALPDVPAWHFRAAASPRPRYLHVWNVLKSRACVMSHAKPVQQAASAPGAADKECIRCCLSSPANHDHYGQLPGWSFLGYSSNAS